MRKFLLFGFSFTIGLPLAIIGFVCAFVWHMFQGGRQLYGEAWRPLMKDK